MYYCWLVDSACNQSKIPSMLKDMHRIVVDNYDLEAFDSKSSINKDLADACWQVLDNYNLKPLDKKTGSGGQVVSFSKISTANDQVEHLREGLIKSVEGMSRNIESAESLELVSRNLKKEANDFQRGAEQVEEAAQSRNFWFFSQKWMLIYGSIGALVIGILLVAYYYFL